MPHNRVTTPKHRQVTQPILYSAAEYYDEAGRNDTSFGTDDHDFFAQICDELAGQVEVVIAGNTDSVRHFRAFVLMHRPAMAAIMTYEVASDLDDGQFAVFTRETSSDN